MARTNRIIITPDKGYWFEGIVKTGETFSPGMVVQIDPTVSLIGGHHTCKMFSRDADGDRPQGPHIIVCEDIHNGRTTSDTYAAGERFVGFIPQAGCELNILFNDVSGTGATSDISAGALFITDTGTGMVINTTGSPECEIAMALEAYADLTADQLVWSVWTGH